MAGADIVVAAGGDGTVNEVLNGLCDLPLGRRPTLGVIPLGTVNVFARELGIPSPPADAWEMVVRGRTRELDVPFVEHAGGLRRFVQVAGAGLDAEAIRRVRWNLKRLAGPLAYIVAGFSAVAGRLPVVEVTADTVRASGEVVMLGNGRLYGGGFVVFPGADPQDGMLDVSVMARANVLAMARAATAAWHGRSRSLPGVQHLRASNLQLRSVTPGARFQVEGDDVGELPARFAVEGLGLRVKAGARRGARSRAPNARCNLRACSSARVRPRSPASERRAGWWPDASRFGGRSLAGIAPPPRGCSKGRPRAPRFTMGLRGGPLWIGSLPPRRSNGRRCGRR